MALWLLSKRRILCVGAKPNVPFVRVAEIELEENVRWENRKYRRVGNVCLPVR